MGKECSHICWLALPVTAVVRVVEAGNQELSACSMWVTGTQPREISSAAPYRLHELAKVEIRTRHSDMSIRHVGF